MIGGAGEESVAEGGGERGEGRRAGLVELEELANGEVEGGIVAAVAVEGVLGADGAAVEEEAGSGEVAGEAGVVQGGGVPGVAAVDVGAGVDEVAEAVDVAGPRRLEQVPRRHLPQRQPPPLPLLFLLVVVHIQSFQILVVLHRPPPPSPSPASRRRRRRRRRRRCRLLVG